MSLSDDQIVLFIFLGIVTFWLICTLLYPWWVDNHPPKFCPKCGCPIIEELSYHSREFNTKTGAGKEFYQYTWQCAKFKSGHTFILRNKYISEPIESECAK